MQQFRDNGAIGALLDEYEKAIKELNQTISSLNSEQLLKIVDYKTDDKDCRSIQTILTHVVESGYTYVIEIRKWLGENLTYHDKIMHNDISSYQKDLLDMFDYNVLLFEDHPSLKIEEFEVDKKIKVRWGQFYDVEQLLEHAIVHILRHRRQIERFILRL